jgi:hypothetical protein
MEVIQAGQRVGAEHSQTTEGDAVVAVCCCRIQRLLDVKLNTTAGELNPDGMQRLLRRADWDVGGVRDDVRGYVIERLGDAGGVLISGPREWPDTQTGGAGDDSS